MKIYLKPPVKAGERFFVIQTERTIDPALPTGNDVRVGDDVRAEGGGEVNALLLGVSELLHQTLDPVLENEVAGEVRSGQRAEFLLGLSVQGGQSRLMRVSGLTGDAWNGAVALETQRELRRGRDVFVLHGVVTAEGEREAVTVWSAEIHVMPERGALFADAIAGKRIGTERRVQALAEEAWRLHCRNTGQPCGLEPVRASAPEMEVSDEGLDWEAALMVPDGWEGQMDEVD